MAEQAGTPGSTADTSVNGGKNGAPKDKQCPFCNQPFTSSSLGRHLDLYIKERNPKPADGLHDVVEIRKMRGGITRRQPRSSMSKREDSTPAGTPGTQDRRSPPLDPEMRRSPSLRMENIDSSYYPGNKAKFVLNKATWESTGVMNHIPPARNGELGRNYEEEPTKRIERNRSVSKQILAKSTFDQKQKMVDALDNARAAELALREIMGSIRAAKQRIEGPAIFDYDPLTLDFPSLTLQCLPPPPTLQQTHPLATPISWSILPPGDTQYQALRAHFQSVIHNWRISCAIATTAPRDDFSYPPPAYHQVDDPSEVVQRAEEVASELEIKISDHLHQAFGHWNSLPAQKRTELWTLELARSVGKKAEENQTLRKEKELAEQEASHLRLQVDELSRLQHPREFRLKAPGTLPVDSKFMTALAECSQNIGIGWNLSDRNLHLDSVVELAIGRWKEIVKEARGGSGMNGQRSLSGDSTVTTPQVPTPQQRPTQPHNSNIPRAQSHTTLQVHSQPPHHTSPTIINGADMGSDADADADADMEEDDYRDMTDTSHSTIQRPPDGQNPQAANFRLANGNPSHGMEGLENAPYVRIGA